MNRRAFLGAAMIATAAIALPTVGVAQTVTFSDDWTDRQWAETILAEYLAEPEQLVIWISAPCGYGKSTLALRVANRLHNDGRSVRLHYATNMQAIDMERDVFGGSLPYISAGLTGLRHHAARYFIMDEPGKETPEGSPIAFAKKRTSAWADGKVVVFSADLPPPWVDRHIRLPKFDPHA